MIETTFWIKKTQEEIKSEVMDALDKNVSYKNSTILGVPATYLDERVFNQDASFLANAPFMYAMTQNPNHIGCHTMGKSEHFFEGTQNIERELINICAVDILKGEEGNHDGYVASGGTEANLQALWIYRNYFVKEFSAKADEIAIICSEDTHYSVNKGANLLTLGLYKVPVNNDNRSLDYDGVRSVVQEARMDGKKFFIVISNMMTTMFGSVDDPDLWANVMSDENVPFKMHVDAAYGGFYYPFVQDQRNITFENEHISSFTLDAHKMAQSPYGTGIFIARKGLMQYANTQEASYVEGEDYTLIGSRSGANAIAVWMILSKHGPYGWVEKVFILEKRTEWLSQELKRMNIQFFRDKGSNIVTIKANHISSRLASKYGLVPDNHQNPNWYKIVVMDHVTVDKLEELVVDIKAEMLMRV